MQWFGTHGAAAVLVSCTASCQISKDGTGTRVGTVMNKAPNGLRILEI